MYPKTSKFHDLILLCACPTADVILYSEVRTRRILLKKNSSRSEIFANYSRNLLQGSTKTSFLFQVVCSLLHLFTSLGYVVLGNSIVEATYGEKSLAGLTAHPALSPKLRWMAQSPNPMKSGAKWLGIFMLSSSVTAMMISTNSPVPNICKRLNVEETAATFHFSIL